MSTSARWPATRMGRIRPPRHVYTFLAVVMSAVLALAARGTPAAPVTVTDDAGEVVRLSQPAARIVALAPHATELVFAAGAGGKLVGVVAGSDFPAAAREIPLVGDANTIDLERIVAARPDLVVTWPYTTVAQLDALRRRGIAVFTSNPATIDDIAADLSRLGVLAGTRDEAEQAATAFRAEVHALAVKAAARKGPPLRVFYEIWDPPIFTIGGKHLISEAIALCGGHNVFADLTTAAPVVSAEAVLAARPEVIVAGSDDGHTPSWLARWNDWPGVPAVANGHLVTVDGNLLHRPGPRFADGVAALCAALAR